MSLLDVVVWIGEAARWVLGVPWWAAALASAVVVALALWPLPRGRRSRGGDGGR